MTYLEIDDNEGNNDGCEQVAKVWSILSVNSLLKTIELVWLGQHEMEEGDNGAFEFGSLISSDGNWGETFPENLFADVGGDEKGNT